VIGIKGAGEMASGVAWRLHRAGFGRLFMMELERPVAIRRSVAFSEAIYLGRQEVEGVAAARVDTLEGLEPVWNDGCVPVLADPRWAAVAAVTPDVLIDAILAKSNLGTAIDDAPFVVALGPGFTAGQDAHVVIATNRGHHLGRVRHDGGDEPNTGIPGDLGGYTVERVVRAPCDGPFCTRLDIGARVRHGDVVGTVDGHVLRAGVTGVVRGLLRAGLDVCAGMKVGDVDPRGETSHCYTVSDKARALGGAALEAILWRFNR
jgi:xanthine dehydrogenase accessory factor